VNGVPTKDTHFVGLVDGLALICKPPKGDAKIGSRSWCLFYRIKGQKNPNQPKTKGLGGYPSTSTAEAVRKAQAWRSLLAQGIDPKEQERAKAKQLKVKQGKQVPLKVAAQDWHDFQIARPNVSAPDYQKKYRAVEKHIFPILGDMPISEIEYEDVLNALRPIWEEMTPTAWKIQGGLRQIFDRAGFKVEDNVARWTDNLDKDLPHPDSFHKIEHQPSLHWEKMPEFVNKLMQVEKVGAKALLLSILTVGRSSAICLAEWGQFDFKKKIWQRPAEIMKSVRTKKGSVKYPHAQPLSDSTIEFLKNIRGKTLEKGSISDEGLIFRASQGGRIYDSHISDLIPELGYSRKDAVPHGFRRSFRNWSLDKTNYGELVTEKCMAHQIGDEVRNVYVSTEFIERRRPCIEEWCKWCFEGELVKAAKVIPIGKGGKK
tara:strand:+ start:268 stop:1557 length:1290 start_codon:yes stop_codon:yes gene_type:complete